MLTEICTHEWEDILEELSSGPHIVSPFVDAGLSGAIISSPMGKVKLVTVSELLDNNKEVRYYFVEMESNQKNEKVNTVD